MAKYTTTIKTLLDNGFKLKLDTYPIFDEEYRNVLNNKIINHYQYIYEIGFETAELFNVMLESKMNEIMPFYNELYKAQKQLLASDLFKNVDITEDFKGNSTSSASSTSNSNGVNKQLFQDTPQGKIFNNDIENSEWATNFTNNESNNQINDESTNNGTNDYIRRTTGNNGNMYNIEILERIKNNLINIDMLIIDDLSELFMKIW